MNNSKNQEFAQNQELKKLFDEYKTFNADFNKKFERIRKQLKIKLFEENKDLNLLRNQFDETTNILRSVQLDAENEFNSEQFITLYEEVLGRASSDTNQEWEMYFKLLTEYMKEHNHCYFEKGQKYKNKNLGDWVISQRRSLINKNADYVKRNRLMSIKIPDKNTLNWSRHDYSNFTSHANHLLKNITDEEMKSDIQKMINTVEDANKANQNLGDDLGLVDATAIDPYINYTCWVWSNQDASWLRYFKELKRYYIKNKHSAVPANYAHNDINLGTWVLRIRQEYKKGLMDELNLFPSNPDMINRASLLYNLYFIRETDLTKALQLADERMDVLDVGERAAMEDTHDSFSIGEIND